MLVDVSGSMRGKPLEAVQRGLQDAAKRARDQDRLAVATVADDLRWETNWGDSHLKVKKAIDSLQPRGALTRLWDALQVATQHLMDAKNPDDFPSRRRILLITDGHDEQSRADSKALTQALRDARVVVDVIVITSVTDRYLQPMRELAEATGGSAREAPDGDSLRALTGKGIDHVLDMPVYRFWADRLEADGNEHRFALSVAGAVLDDEIAASVPKLPKAMVLVRRAGPWVWALLALPAIGLVYFLRRGRRPPPQVAAPRVYQPQGQPQSQPQAHAPSTTAASSSGAVRTPTEVDAAIAAAAAAERQAAFAPPNPAWQPPPISPPATPNAPPPARPREKTAMAEYHEMPTPGRPIVVLEAAAGPRSGSRFAVDSVDFWIGAASGNNLSVPEDATLSGMHARIRFADNVLRIHDNGSTNGTWLNGVRIDDAGRLLSSGDLLRVGKSEFRVARPDASR